MPRLSAPPAKLGAAPHRIGKTPKHQDGKLIRQRDNPEYRAWYRTREWRELKQAVHIRDSYICQRTGVICAGKYPAPDSPVANHKKAHRGNRNLFFDINNVETVTKEVHDGLIQHEEQESLHHRGIWD